MLSMPSHIGFLYNGLLWIPTNSDYSFEMLGFIPSFLHAEDERSAREQIKSVYIGGWFPLKGFKLLPNGDLKYPEDPPTRRLWTTTLRSEVIDFYQHAWLRISQPDGSWEVAHLD